MCPRLTRSSSENGSDGGPIAALARLPATVLHPDDNVRRALDVFGASQADTLVVTARGTEQVLGTLGEAYAARRYAQETNLAMRGVLGRRISAEFDSIEADYSGPRRIWWMRP